MIEGFVNANLEAVVTIPLLGPAGQTREIAAVVDTGFNGYLTLPPTLVPFPARFVDTGKLPLTLDSCLRGND